MRPPALLLVQFNSYRPSGEWDWLLLIDAIPTGIKPLFIVAVFVNFDSKWKKIDFANATIEANALKLFAIKNSLLRATTILVWFAMG